MERGLARLFALWHPHYRFLIGQLLLAGTLAAGLVYVQNTLLTNLTLSLAAPEPAAAGPALLAASGSVGRLLSHFSGALNLSLPLFILLLFIMGNLLAAAFEYWKIRVIGVLRIRTRNDLEIEILTHLLGKEDFFFARHPPAETVNRITVDLNRVCELRCHMMRVWWCVVLILSYFVFFLLKDWRLGLAVIGSCAASAVWTYRLTRRIKHLDRIYLHQDDHVKSQFEDFLRAAPEVQVGHLYEKVRQGFQSTQDERTGTYMRFLSLSGILRVGDALSPLVAIACTILVVIYMKHSGQGSLALALLPVMIMSLPALFHNASDLIFLNVDLQLAYTSKERLLEYETHERRSADALQATPSRPTGPESPAPDAHLSLADRLSPAAPLRLHRVTYLYHSPNRNQQGGVVEIEAEFASGRWIAIVGRAGSGKTTLLNILLGRLQPQEGGIFYGEEPLVYPWDRRYSAVFSLMPQSLALLNTTMSENLLFDAVADGGADSPSRQLTAADLDMLESAGLGHLCRLKALDMLPRSPPDYSFLQAGLPEIRGRARAHFAKAGGAAVLPYEEGYADPNNWVLEIMLKGKCDRRLAVRTLMREGDYRSLRPLSQTGLGAELTDLGRRLLLQTRDLLALPNFHYYAKKARVPIEEAVWKLRSALAEAAEREALPQKKQLALCAVALTCSPAEFPDNHFLEKWKDPDIQKLFAPEVSILKDIIGDFWQPFILEEINPYLTWRENLAFGVVDRLPEQVILDFLEQEGLNRIFTRLGLEFNIGRLGGNLSGGQGQLLALCRALLRRTPVLILDEPTSHLDPISSARVARLLHTWKTRRIIITVSHDPDFVSKADEIFLMDGGRIIANGTFEHILGSSELFRRALWET